MKITSYTREITHNISGRERQQKEKNGGKIKENIEFKRKIICLGTLNTGISEIQIRRKYRFERNGTINGKKLNGRQSLVRRNGKATREEREKFDFECVSSYGNEKEQERYP